MTCLAAAGAAGAAGAADPTAGWAGPVAAWTGGLPLAATAATAAGAQAAAAASPLMLREAEPLGRPAEGERTSGGEKHMSDIKQGRAMSSRQDRRWTMVYALTSDPPGAQELGGLAPRSLDLPRLARSWQSRDCQSQCSPFQVDSGDSGDQTLVCTYTIRCTARSDALRTA